MTTTNDKPAAELDERTLRLSGRLTSMTIGDLEKKIMSMKSEDIDTIDGSDVVTLDTTGAVFILGITEGRAKLHGFSESAERMLSVVRSEEPEKEAEAPPSEPSRLSLESIGGYFLKLIDNINEIAILVVDIIYWSIISIFRREQYRKGTFTEQSVHMGTTALPIVATILFLVGGISALQSAETLKNFGASIFVADMLALGLARELAPLMTAIIISGRSGSAIASEIATMKFTEELDAIKTMGLNPLRFVVVPKLWAMVVCMPLLNIMALMFGLFGGFLVAITYMGLTINIFYNRLLISLFFWDIMTGLIKSVSFAIIITVVGTYRGLTFTGGADGVGRSTTASVVTSIFAIIIMDSIWGIIFYL